MCATPICYEIIGCHVRQEFKLVVQEQPYVLPTVCGYVTVGTGTGTGTGTGPIFF